MYSPPANKKKPAQAGFFLFLYLLMHCVLSAPFAEFIELNLALNKFFILARPIVYVFARLAAEFYKLIL
jgi:hypothetical protein